MALKLGIKTHQILTNDDEVCHSSLSSILLAVRLSSMVKVLQRNQWPHLSVNLGFHDMEKDNKVYILGHILSGEKGKTCHKI